MKRERSFDCHIFLSKAFVAVITYSDETDHKNTYWISRE